MKSPSARLHEGSKCSLLHNMNSPARNNKKWSQVIVDNIVVRVEVHEGMNFAEKIKGNWHFFVLVRQNYSDQYRTEFASVGDQESRGCCNH